MSGHSKWAQIKHQKGATDAKRGQLFTKLTREITVAARHGGGNPDANPRLRLAIDRARESNMPMENIDRAIRKGLGVGNEGRLEEIAYEGYAPGGVAVMVLAVTDNRNRSVSEIRSSFERHGGKLAEAGAVSWLFSQKGLLAVQEGDPQKAEETALLSIDLGAEDFNIDGDLIEIYCASDRFEELRRALTSRGVKVASAELGLVPKSVVALDDQTAEKALRLLDRLEELDDVQKVYTNADFPAAVLERYRAVA